MSTRIVVEQPIANIHTQNGLAESFVKCLKLIARPLLIKTRFPTSAWGHTTLHVAVLIRMRSIVSHAYSTPQLFFKKELNVFYLRIFGFAVYVSVAPP